MDKVVCLRYSTSRHIVTSLIPPFVYNNLCGSIILTAYIPVYIYLYIINILVTIATPIICLSTKYDSYPVWLRSQVMGIIWPSYWENEKPSPERQSAQLLEFEKRSGASDSVQGMHRDMLKVDDYLSRYLHHVAILLTFGICCPALAFAISCHLGIDVFVLMVLLGRFVKYRDNAWNVNHSTNDIKIDGAMKILEQSCLQWDLYLSHCMWEVVFASSIFFACLCWDMASDRTYWKDAIWLPLVALSIPCAVWSYFYWIQTHKHASSTSNIELI